MRQKLEALIREIDFSKVKSDPEIVSTKVTDLEYESRNDRTFEELKVFYGHQHVKLDTPTNVTDI